MVTVTLRSSRLHELPSKYRKALGAPSGPVLPSYPETDSAGGLREHVTFGAYAEQWLAGPMSSAWAASDTHSGTRSSTRLC
jgi:hypothetical protein